MLQSAKNNINDWEKIAANDSLIQFNAEETQNIGGSFPGIGRNNSLTGTLLSMESGDVSNILETYNAMLIVLMVDKDEIEELKYEESYTNIRDNLLNSKKGRGYSSWLSDAIKNIKKEDYRSEVY